MASASTDSGLWRTTSGSTASISEGIPMHRKSSTSATVSPHNAQLSNHPSQSPLQNGADASATTSKRIRRRKRRNAKTEEEKNTSSSTASCLPGFVAATPLTSSRQSSVPATSVARSPDRKGKGRATNEHTDLPESKSGLPTPTPASPVPDHRQRALATEQYVEPRTQSRTTTISGTEDASPGDSAASSTDELPYTPSPTVSPRVIPQAKVASKTTSALTVSSPFKPAITGFEFLAACNQAAINTVVTPTPKSRAGLGIAGQGLQDMPVEQAVAFPPQPKLQHVGTASSSSGKRRVASSPLTWSTDHKAIDAATLGSPTLGSMREPENEEDIARNAITKAAFSVSQDTILKELAKRKAQRKLDQTLAVPQSVPDSIQNGRLPEPQLAKNRDDRVPQDGVKRRDMAMPQGKRPSSPVSNRADARDHSNVEVPASSAPDRSPLTRDGTTSATADAEEDVDDGASEASHTSFLMHSVVRDDDLASGWKALDTGFNTRENKRRRLESTIYELDRRHRPSQAVITARREMLLAIRKRLSSVLRDWAPKTQYRLETFGSTKYGLDTDSSDLDLCIVDPHRPDGFRNVCDLYDISEPTNAHRDVLASTEEDEETVPSTPFARHKKNQKWAQPDTRKKMALGNIYDVHRLADILRKMGHQQVIAIPNAVVPIVKFKSREGIKADMNCNEQLGVRNSTLIAEYISLKPVIRPFLIFLKVWAKQRNLNDPSGQKGPMSLSSYSLVLMAIAYLQHAGIVPNLQDHQLISKQGVGRETFWSKVPNPDVPKGSHWAKRRYLGDYKAMAIDTTFVKASHLHLQVARDLPPAGKNKRDSTSIGWESGSETPADPDSDKVQGSTQLLQLVEGFFDYYLGFPTENKAVSVWRGRPIDRRVYSDTTTRSSRKAKKTSKALREGESWESDSSETEATDPSLADKEMVNPRHGQTNGRGSLSDSETTAASETTTITEDEELQALYAKLEGKMRKLGVKDDTPSFELTLKSSKRSKEKRSHVINGSEEAELSLPAMQEIDALEQIEQADTVGTASSAHRGLEASQASPETNLFPVPPVEDPESFVEPPTWTQPLVVQDPFIHTRNTTMNIMPETVELIWKEMQRALEMVNSGEPLDKICSNVRHEAGFELKGRFRSHREVERRRAARAEQRKANRIRKPKKAARLAEQAPRGAQSAATIDTSTVAT